MPPRSAWVVNYIPSLQARGLSANAALAELRSQGLGIRRQTFLQAWGQTRAELEARVQVSQARLDRRPTGPEVTPMATRQASGFLYTVSAALREGGTGEVYFTPTAVKFDRLVSYDRALQEALGALANAQELEGSLVGDTILGGLVYQVREMTPTADIGDLFS